MIALLIALIYIGLMIYLANVEQIRGESHPLLTLMQYSLVIFIAVLVLNALAFALMTPDQVNDPEVAKQLQTVDRAAATGFVVFGIVSIVVMIFLIRSPILHQLIESYFYRKSKHEFRTYDSTLSVHKLAMMLVVIQVIAVGWIYVISGGTDGLDYSYDSSLQALGDLAVTALLYITFALLGVGWLTRRNIPEIVNRLDIRFPTRQDVMNGVGMAVLLYVMLLIATSIWSAMVSPELLEQQTAASQQLFEAFNSSLLLGFLLALMTGISEETLFRGAIQPVFGLIPTSIFFTIIHVQYTLTPATIILFIVSLGFGWLRLRVSTSAAIIAHITYNFIPFLLFALISSSGAV